MAPTNRNRDKNKGRIFHLDNCLLIKEILLEIGFIEEMRTI